MISLLWKEYRESRAWALCLAAFNISIVLLGKGQTFVGQIEAFTVWTFLPALPALYFGSSSSRDERRAESTDFLLSRPPSAIQLLSARTIVRLGAAAAIAVATGAVYLLVHPPAYNPHLTALRFAAGLGYTFAIVGLPCLIGLGLGEWFCSRSGGLTILVTAVGLFLFRRYASPTPNQLDSVAMAWLPAAVLLTMVVTFLSFRANRQLRVGIHVAGLAVVLLASWAFRFVPSHETTRKTFGSYTWSNVSPDGRYAIAQQFSSTDSDQASSSHIMRLSDGAKAAITWPPGGLGGTETFWTRSGVAFAHSQGSLYTVRLGLGSNPLTSVLPVSRGDASQMRPSPDRSLALISSPVGEKRKLEVINVETTQKLRTLVADTRIFWWQSNTEIGYIDRHRNRHIVNVLNGREVE